MYPVLLAPLDHNGKRYEDGDLAPLTPKQAAPLIALGIVGEAIEAQVEESDGIDDDAADATVEESGSADDATAEQPVQPELINLNTASTADLISLPNIGRGLAARIEKARPIQTLDSVPELLGVNAAQWDEIAPLVTV